MNGTRIFDSHAIARFWAKVAVGAPADCWEWQAATNKAGYGVFALPNRQGSSLAHRAAWVVATGQWPSAGLMLLHSCDNRSCVNPAHLREGSAQDNATDMVSRGRHRPRGGSRLTREQIDEIIAAVKSDETQRSIASRFEIDQSYVSRIASGRRGRREGVA